MAVHDGHDVGAPAVDFSVNEALKVNLPARRVHRVAVQCELDDVIRGNTAGRHVPGEQEPVRIRIVPTMEEYEDLFGKPPRRLAEVLESGVHS